MDGTFQWDNSIEDGPNRYNRSVAPGVNGEKRTKEQIIELARTHPHGSELLKGSVKYKELQYKSGEAYSIVIKDHSKGKDSLGSATICLSQGNTIKIAGSKEKQERLLEKLWMWSMPWNDGAAPHGDARMQASGWHS